MGAVKAGFQLLHGLVKLKWVPEILLTLHEESKSFSHILSAIPLLSPTELNRKLKLLQQEQIIEKRKDGRYRLLCYGEDVVAICELLVDFYQRHHEKQVS